VRRILTNLLECAAPVFYAVHSFLACLALIAWLAWITILILPWQPWRNREILEKLVELQDASSNLEDVSVVIPARNEAGIIGKTLASLTRQGDDLRVILVDDCSTDGTSEIARQITGLRLTIVTGTAPPAGWAGKLWALDQGLRQVRTPYTLLLDADICLSPGAISALKNLAVLQARPFVSVMACLPMGSFWEKLLTPAFIYFFKLLYPFGLANSAWRRFASAAGGCIFLETRLFDAIGGLASIRAALIDDCALAKRVKQAGFRTWTGQSQQVVCIRSYSGLGELWDMVARSAFTQLRYSPALLLVCSLLMLVLFVIPPIGIFALDPAARYLGAAAWLAMAVTYLPTLLFYHRNPSWILAIPLIGVLYLGMTWTSALRYWQGERSHWKDRSYLRPDYRS
jgi:hopene-associated glycosyltransferase HpnB